MCVCATSTGALHFQAHLQHFVITAVRVFKANCVIVLCLCSAFLPAPISAPPPSSLAYNLLCKLRFLLLPLIRVHCYCSWLGSASSRVFVKTGKNCKDCKTFKHVFAALFFNSITREQVKLIRIVVSWLKTRGWEKTPTHEANKQDQGLFKLMWVLRHCLGISHYRNTIFLIKVRPSAYPASVPIEAS